jgi:ADP-ribosyl-[dinitrogen reductase] hydrolase
VRVAAVTDGQELSLDLEDRFIGCLLGCAVGDALGAPFEGLWSANIPAEAALLGGFDEYEGYPRGQFTDDTQLTVASVEAIVAAGGVDPERIARSIARLWKHDSVIGPGGACTRAAHTFLKTEDWQTCGAPEGQAGNGTAMRTAVVGIFFVHEPDALPQSAADVSRITHQDPRSIAGGVAIAKAAQLLATGSQLSPDRFCNDIAAVMLPFDPGFAELVRSLPLRLTEEREVALAKIAWAGMSRPEFDRPIITPFVMPTVLAALWMVLQFPDSWARAVSAAIKLGGDADTLGAIVGALMGARLGVGAIPAHLAEAVVDADRLRVLAVRYHSLVAGS